MSSEKPRRFVVLHHELSDTAHWDLMLEQADTLATWQLMAPPDVAAASATPARRIGDHRKAYLDYEGPISGGRGTVRRTDQGTYETLAADDVRWVVVLSGRILHGQFELRRTAPDADAWTFQPVGG